MNRIKSVNELLNVSFLNNGIMQSIVNTSTYILSILISISIILQHSMSKQTDRNKPQKKPSEQIVQDVNDSNSDDSIKIVVAEKLPGQLRLAQQKQTALTFWMNRVRHQKKEKTIEIQDNNQTSALDSVKIPVSTTRARIPIVGHKEQPEKERRSSGMIIIPEQNAQQGVERYKKNIFKGEETITANPTSKPIYTISQQQKRRRFEKQVQVVEQMNKPRWMKQKDKRRYVNEWKYPNSNTTQYRQETINRSTRSMMTEAREGVAWSDYIRKREINKLKNKAAKDEERKKQKQQDQEERKRKLREEEEECEKIIQGLLGVNPTKKIKKDTDTWGLASNNEILAEAQRQRNLILDQLTEQNNEDLQSGQIKEGEAIQTHVERIRKPRYGLKEVIKPYQSKAPQFINIVLSHNYSMELILPQTKRIPDVFESSIMYKNVFHYMITNQCIADVSGRLEALEKEKTEPLRVSITSYRQNNQGQIQIYLKQIPRQEKQFTLRNFSLSKYRIGLVTSQCDFSRKQYGIVNKESNAFGFLVMLVTPQTKQQLKSDIKCIANCKVSELDWLFKKRKSCQAYFFDLEKITTHVREYLAISNIQYSELAHFIFNPMAIDKETRTFVQNKEILSNILNKLQQVFNSTQFQSIRMMVRRQKGIVLLQGPPGTGKTSTLMGLLSAQYQYLKKTYDNRKIMVCAPSNAAVDHIVKRIQSEGLLNGDGQIVKPVVLRVGIVQTTDPQILSASLDNLCEEKMIAEHQIQQEMNQLTTPQIKEKIIMLQKQLKTLAGQQDKIKQKKSQILRFQKSLYSFRKEKCITSRKLYSIYEKQYLSKAEIILTTLSSSGNQKLDQIRGQIACLIIDEAAQATEPNLVITLQTGVEKILLVGDPYQLPATCMSSDCNITLFNRSLFERFLDANIKPYFLNIQYRMAPLIRQFPSEIFYQNRLVDAESLLSRKMPNFLECFKGRNVIFLDIKYGQETKKGHSHINEAQGRAIGLIVKCMLDQSVSMGVITPYKAQKHIIVRQSKAQLRSNPEEVDMIDKSIMINTVDSFQGQERDIIIVSTVRANSRGQVGFLVDERRINVSLTRSKLVLIVVGHGDTLGSNQIWNKFLNWIQSKKLYYQVHQQHQLKPILREVFQYRNQLPIRRKKYHELSTDVRKIQRKQIQSEYFHRKRHIQKSIEPPFQAIKKDMSRQEVPQINKARKVQIAPDGNKYALDINQSNLIVKQKRKKQDQDQQFENMQNRMKILQQTMKRNCSYMFG